MAKAVPVRQVERIMQDKHTQLFERIAPFYRLFFPAQVISYRKLLRENRHLLNIPPAGSVLDIGCGTGALAYCLREMGYSVTGVDASAAMIRQAQRTTKRFEIELLVGDVTAGIDRDNKSFDLVIGSYIAHGLIREKRIHLYEEADRLARCQVLFHDFNGRRCIGIDVVEWFEGSDYRRFIQSGKDEMEKHFNSVEAVTVGRFIAWYLCIPKS